MIASEQDLITKDRCDKNIKEMHKKLEPIPLILERLKNIGEHFDEKGIIGKIEKHVEKTNGRVRSLEIWKAMLIGGWAVTTILFPVLFVYFMSSFRHELKNIVNTEINTAIDEYDNKIFDKTN